MKTLIELYDERPIENVIGSEMFRPDRTVFLCEAEIASNKQIQQKIGEYFSHCGLKTKPIFMECSQFDAGKIGRMLKKITEQYPDCALDISGGTETALFACGSFCAESGIPAFTYSRKRNMFFDIHKADFADKLPCKLQHDIEDCFLMAGGALRTGRVDNQILDGYENLFDPFFRLYMKYRSDWNHIVGYIVRASQGKKNDPVSLHVSSPYTVKGDHGAKLKAPEKALEDAEKIGMISGLLIANGQVEFDFADMQIRTWLRDVGSVLELYIYKACKDTQIFNDVMTSAIVDWEGDARQDNVTNEIDVMTMHGIFPAFISCKTCAVTTEALNELAILRDRFGGEAAKAVIVTTQRCKNITRHRASELNIEVIDLDDLKNGSIVEIIKKTMREE